MKITFQTQMNWFFIILWLLERKLVWSTLQFYSHHFLSFIILFDFFRKEFYKIIFLLLKFIILSSSSLRSWKLSHFRNILLSIDLAEKLEKRNKSFLWNILNEWMKLFLYNTSNKEKWEFYIIYTCIYWFGLWTIGGGL